MDINCKEVSPKVCDLITVECLGCGFHLGVDQTFLDQVGSITVDCPSCKWSLKIDE